MKTKESEKIQIEFSIEHLYVLVHALETYSRLQSGQIGIALDSVFFDRDLSWNERNYLENAVRYIAFPSNPKRAYNDHEGFYDQYNNEYDEKGNIVNESDEWKRLKNRPHLDHPNSSFGVGCKEMKNGTIAFEIKKVIEQYFHYRRNRGYRAVMDVSGDGMKWSYSDVPVPKVIGFEPSLTFKVPKKYHKKIQCLFDSQKYEEMWKYFDNVVFKNKPLPKGSCSKLSRKGDDWCIVVEEPYKP